jgi:fatty acid desaturase
MFESGKRNEWVSRFVANLVVGLGYGWWMHKHSKHHGNPNTMNKDMDMDANAIVYTPQDAETRTGAPAWFMRRQGWFFLPAMTLTGLDLHVKTLRMLLAKEPVKHRGIELTLMAIRLIGFPVLVILLAGPVVGIAFMVLETLVFGFLMGGSFAPNHIGMPIIDETQRVDYLRRQVLTSRNISGGTPMAIWMGGLNYQVEHHLFPSMASANLKRARPIVRAYCLELGVHYTETTLPQAMRHVVKYIHRVGIKHRDPFDCPAAAQFRTI